MQVKAIASALPGWEVDNATISAWSGLSQTMLDERIGVRRRFFLRHDETGVDLAMAALDRLRAAEPAFDAGRVGLLVYVTQTPDYRLPHNAALLQTRAGVPDTAACFDLNLGCSGYVYALSVCKGMMLGEQIDEALIVTCDPYSKIMDRANRDVVGLFGDAATVTWLRGDGAGTIGRGDFGTDGGGAQHLIVRSGGAARPLDHLDGSDPQADEPADRHLHMNGRAIFNFMMTRVPATLERCLARNGLGRDDVDFFILHQASRFLLETARDKFGLPADKMPMMLAETGNTVSSTVPLVLQRLLDERRCDGKIVLVAGFGVGLSWASNIIRFGGQP